MRSSDTCQFTTVLLLTLAVSLSFLPNLNAAEVYGTVAVMDRQSGGRTPLPGIPIDIICPDYTDSGTTDDYGEYRFSVPDCQQCKTIVYYDGQQIRGTALSYAEPSRFDHVMMRSGGGWMMVPMLPAPPRDRCKDNMKWLR